MEEHYFLRRPTPDEPSQIGFELNQKGVRCLIYRKDSVTKTYDGGLNDMRRECKIVWVYPSKDKTRCPVCLVEKYLSLCPPFQKRNNFYLQSLQRPTPKTWYSNQVVGQNSISKVVKQMMKDANIEGFFTNHSLRRTGGTRLFRGGIDRKLVKETTGHHSDAVDAYQITSDNQRAEMSKIIREEPSEIVSKIQESNQSDKEKSGDIGQNYNDSKHREMCNCQINSSNVGEIVNQLIGSLKKGTKTTIKLQIKIQNK